MNVLLVFITEIVSKSCSGGFRLHSVGSVSHHNSPLDKHMLEVSVSQLLNEYDNFHL